MPNCHLHVLLQGFKSLKPLWMIPIQIEGASSWLTGNGPFANGSDMLSMSALDEEIRQVPVNERKQSACLLIGAGGTGKTTIILELLLPTFVEFFPAQDGEDRYAIVTCAHAQSDAISNETFRAKNSTRCCWLQSG